MVMWLMSPKHIVCISTLSMQHCPTRVASGIYRDQVHEGLSEGPVEMVMVQTNLRLMRGEGSEDEG